MKTSKLSLTLILALFALSTWAQGPNGSGTYYKDANGLKGQALKTKLFNIVNNGKKQIGYSGLKAAYTKTDVRADGYLRDWYSNITNYQPGSNFSGGTTKEGQGYNREHLIPQSWFNKSEPMKSDIVHVVPTDVKINGMRSDFFLGEVGNISEQSANGYSKKGSCKSSIGYSGTVFEPNDVIKGDIARIYFYMATCYQDKITNWSGGLMTGTAYQPFAQWCFDMFMRWSKQDPIDEVEIARNNAIYGEQKNRNPFVDYPGLEDYIWGDLKNVAFSYDNYTTTGIETLDNTTIVPTDHHTYDLRGCQVDDSRLAPGIYIRNGKKFIVR